MKYRVGTFREAGLEARWTKTFEGKPFILVRDPNASFAHQRDMWWCCDPAMVKLMEREGVREGFNCATILGDLFSLPMTERRTT